MKRSGSKWLIAATVVFLTAFMILGLGWLWLTHTDEWGSKSEGAILQYVEFTHRGVSLASPEFVEHNGRHLVCVHGASTARVWIMLDPHFAPYYKQLPMELFTLTSAEMDQIARLPCTDRTVRACLNSHVDSRRP